MVPYITGGAIWAMLDLFDDIFNHIFFPKSSKWGGAMGVGPIAKNQTEAQLGQYEGFSGAT